VGKYKTGALVYRVPVGLQKYKFLIYRNTSKSKHSSAQECAQITVRNRFLIKEDNILSIANLSIIILGN
jgi:hypothetical protein